MIVLLFQDRFAPLVRVGSKIQTIRGARKQPVKVGDHLSLRRWTGAAYRSPQEVLRESYCTLIAPVMIGKTAGDLFIDDRPMDSDDSHAFARNDGFADVVDMLNWFGNVHDLPFAGMLIRWSP
jgi:hypothetical protein